MELPTDQIRWTLTENDHADSQRLMIGRNPEVAPARRRRDKEMIGPLAAGAIAAAWLIGLVMTGKRDSFLAGVMGVIATPAQRPL